MKVGHILVTTDLSEEAVRPYGPITELAREWGARITVLYVVEDAAAIPHGAPLAPPLHSPDVEARVAEARKALEGVRAHFKDVPVTLDVVTGADIAKTIVAYAKQVGAGVIALATHGRTGFRHLMLGSVAEAVVRHASVPVVVFPRPHE